VGRHIDLCNRALMYEESLKENAAAFVQQRKRTFVPGVPFGGAGPSKRAAVEALTIYIMMF
jgi:hypothetical protein